MPLRVAVIDDHPVFRAGLRAILAGEEDLRLVAEAGGRDSSASVEAAHADVVLIDMSAPAPEGLAAARELLRRDPGCRLLVLSRRVEESSVADALAAGAMGFFGKEQPVADLLTAVRAVGEGRRYVPPTLSLAAIEARMRRGRAGPLGILSARERQVFDLLVQGLTNELVAGNLGISKRTVETHRSRILKKLHVHSAVELIRLAARHGLLGT
jgi:DNA-binding NarL/FixJ family response regulator